MTPPVDPGATNVIAGMVLTTPLWLPAINTYGQTLLWIMGVTWLAMQMYYKWKGK